MNGKELNMIANFSLDNFRITDTRAPHNDTDYVTVGITVGNMPPVTRTVRVGDVNNGDHHVGLGVSADIPTDHAVPVVFSYVILNSGHGDPSQIEKGAELALSTLGSKAAQAATTAAGGALGAYLGAELGTAVVPLIGTAIGAIAGWLVSGISAIVFANCDGTVAAGVNVYSSTDLISKTAAGHRITVTVQHPGTDSADGCGGNSNYYTTQTISTVASTSTVIDLNGTWAYGGVPGPVITVTGNGITVNMSAYHRPPAHGSIVDNHTVTVTFPDDKTYTGKLQAPSTIRWTNNTAWTKVAKTVAAGH